MTKEDKQLLFLALCTMLPYHVRLKVWLKDGTIEEGFLDLEHNYADVLRDAFYYNKIEDIKPYLRPMSSMTEEESNELESITFPLMKKDWDGNENPSCIRWIDIPKYMDFILSHYFDYRGLIEKGLALEAPEGMYGKEEQQ